MLTVLLAATAIGTGGCGDDSTESSSERSTPRPPDSAPAVAVVGDQRITKRQFDHWRTAIVKARPGISDSQLERETMRFLVEAAWIEERARELGIRVDERRLRQRFERETADTFPDDDALDRALASTGRTREDALFQLRLTELQARLIARLRQRVEVDGTDVARYYRTHRDEFDGPLAAVRSKVRRAIRAQREEEALAGFTDAIARRFRDRTHCARGYAIAPQCADRTADRTSDQGASDS